MPSSFANPPQTHGVCEEYGDVASAEAERRVWYLFEASCIPDRPRR